MRDLIDEYGMTILAAIVIIFLMITAVRFKDKEASILGNIGLKQTTEIKNRNEDLASNLIEVEQKISSYRNKNSELPRNYANVVKNYESEIRNFTQSSSWQKPIDTTEITGDFMYYDNTDTSSGVHLGVDFASKEGTAVYAPSNGVIFISSDGCPTGSLGDKCSGKDENAVSYGGNQIYFITIHNGKVFVFTFSHLKAGTVHSYGYVQQGEKIGEVGNSGNSSGPHSHIEAYYLGPVDLFNDGNSSATDGDRIINFLLSDTTASFGCGWGSTGLVKTLPAITSESQLTLYNGSPVRFDISILF